MKDARLPGAILLATLTASCSDCSARLVPVEPVKRDAGAAPPSVVLDGGRIDPLDALAPDAPANDAAAVDAYAPDAAPPDASPPDAAPPDAAPPDAAIACASPGTHTFTVFAAFPDGIDTGLDLRACRVSIHAFGQASYGYEGNDCGGGMATTDPDGHRSIGGMPCTQKVDGSATMSTAPVGALIGRDDPSAPWFLVGSAYTAELPPSTPALRPLRLLFNDAAGAYGDNTGFYLVTVDLEDH